MKTFLELVSIQSKLMAYISACGENSSWSKEFCGEEVKRNLEKWFKFLDKTPIDWESFSIEQLLALGFSWWDEDKKCLLIPLHFRRVFYTKDIEDNDQRFGCLAYGFNVIDGKVDFKTKSGIFL